MLVPFLGLWYLICLHSVQSINFATRSCLWKYFVFTLVEHRDIVWLTVSSPCVHSRHLGSAPFLGIFAWYILVARLWFYAASMKRSFSTFIIELLSHWWVAVLSTPPLSFLRGYRPCRGFSLHVFLCHLGNLFWLSL